MKSFQRYAEYYDLIYHDKDYEKECDFIEEAFRRFSPHPVKNILDGGCGTGGHAIPLARRGYEITGIDNSEVMIKHARSKAKKEQVNVDFQVGDIRKFNLNKKFDACICMFAVMDYITQTEEFIQCLGNIGRHLKEGSLLLFDFWNGAAVLRILPSVRVKVSQNEELRIVRVAEPELDAFNHLCHVHYRLLINQGSTLIDEILETHTVRYYFPQEIAHYLEDGGFEVLRTCPFLNLDGEVDENIWNTATIARATRGKK